MGKRPWESIWPKLGGYKGQKVGTNPEVKEVYKSVSGPENPKCLIYGPGVVLQKHYIWSANLRSKNLRLIYDLESVVLKSNSLR